MSAGSGDDADDWFARFEREARASAEQPPASPPPGSIPNPFDAPGTPPPAAPPVAPPAEWEPQPTQAMERIEPEPTQLLTPAPPGGAPTGETQALVPAPRRPPGGAVIEPGSALDALFGEERFREYERGPDPSEAPFADRSRSRELVRVDPGSPPPPPRELGRTAKVLFGVGGGLLALVALAALFLVGTRLPDLLGPAPAVVASPTPTPSASLGPLAQGPVPPGEHSWDELLGGECLEPYTDAWQERYTVVACDTPHAAQMVYRAYFPEALAGDPFPGQESLAAEMSLLCSAPGIVDLPAAGAVSDAQMQGSYPVTAEQWRKDPSYYCFFSRSSGESLTGSVALPHPPTAP